MPATKSIVKKILIRTDASILIGSGHVIRCRTLARELSKHGVEVSFVCRRQPGDLIDLLKQEFKVIILTNLPTQIEGRKEKIEKKVFFTMAQFWTRTRCERLSTRSTMTELENSTG